MNRGQLELTFDDALHDYPVPAEGTFETYRATGKGPLVDFISKAITESGCSILDAPDPHVAPFVFIILTPGGERLRLICYAFLANKYRQGKRPPDEHRFQVKYGSDFQRYHRLYFADGLDELTMMFGVHLEKGVIVAVDPRMHEITWFSKSVEFKTSNLNEAKTTGWVGWERSRVMGGRRKILSSYQDEVLLGFTPQHFLRYVAFERLTQGMAPGERHLLIDRMGSPSPSPSLQQHPLEQAFGRTAHEILDLIAGTKRLEVAMRGRVAESHLEEQLQDIPGVTSVNGIGTKMAGLTLSSSGRMHRPF